MNRNDITFEMMEEYLNNPETDNLAMPSEMYYAIINNYERVGIRFSYYATVYKN